MADVKQESPEDQQQQQHDAVPLWLTKDSYEAMVRQSIQDMVHDLQYFDANVLRICDRRFGGDAHDVFQHFRNKIHEAFCSEDNVANLQFDFKRAWKAGLLTKTEQPKREEEATVILDHLRAHKTLSTSMDRKRTSLASLDMATDEKALPALLETLEDLRKVHDLIMKANAEFPGSVPESDVKQMDGWEEQRESLLRRAESRVHSVAVVGLEKTGKSTCCNALIGMRLLPAAVERCTMLATVIRPSKDGEYRMEVSYQNEAGFESALAEAEKLHYQELVELEQSRAARDPEYRAKTLAELRAAAEEAAASIVGTANDDNDEDGKDANEAAQTELERRADAKKRSFDVYRIRLHCQPLVGKETETFEGRDELLANISRFTANPQTMYAVRRVVVWTPELQHSRVPMEIVDVPGFDSPIEEHRTAASASLAASDAFLFVTNGAANVDLTQPALQLVRHIQKASPGAMEKGYALITHLDMCQSRAEFQDRKKKAVNRLRELGFVEDKIFCACPPLTLHENADEEKSEAALAMSGDQEEHAELSRKARRFGLEKGFSSMKESLQRFVMEELPRRRRAETLTLVRLASRAADQSAERVGERLRAFLPADQMRKMRLIEGDGRLSDDAVREIMESIETSIARTHNNQWIRVWGKIWQNVHTSAGDWLAESYFDRYVQLSREWKELFHAHYEADKKLHQAELYERFKARLGVLPIVLEEPDPCEAELNQRVWLVEHVHQSLTDAGSRVARSIFEVLHQYYTVLSRKCFEAFTDDVEALQIQPTPLPVSEKAVRLKVEFNTLQAARLLEKRVLRYPRWHPRRELREITDPTGVADWEVKHREEMRNGCRVIAGSGLKETGAAGQPAYFPSAAQRHGELTMGDLDEEEKMYEKQLEDDSMGGDEQMDEEALEAVMALLGGKGVKCTKLNAHKKGTSSTAIKVVELEDGSHAVMYASRKKKMEDIAIPVKDLVLDEGADEAFGRIGKKALAKAAGRCVMLTDSTGTRMPIRLVFNKQAEYDDVLGALRTLRNRESGKGNQQAIAEDEYPPSDGEDEEAPFQDVAIE